MVSPSKRPASDVAVSPRSTRSRSGDTNGTMTESQAKTFGVEFEFVLAFHRSELENVLSQHSIEAEVINDPTKIAHERVLDVKVPSNRRNRWPSWVLKVSDTDLTVSWCLNSEYFDDDDMLYVRKYFLEPLLIAKNVLNDADCNVDVVGISYEGPHPTVDLKTTPGGTICLARRGKDFSKWNLTEDTSLIGLTKGEMRARLPRLINEQNQDDWDSAGMELITPIFKQSQKAAVYGEMIKYFTALNHIRTTPPTSPFNVNFPTDPTFAAVDSLWAGTHVHIGFDLPQDTCTPPLRVLQHLAFIILTHESLITQLHPKHRSGLLTEPQHPRSMPDSLPNSTPEFRLIAAEEAHVRSISLSYVATEMIQSNLTYFCDVAEIAFPATWNDLRDEIFHPEQEVKNLLELLNFDPTQPASPRWRMFIVNWSNMLDCLDGKENSKPTIEFRQHGCTLDVAEVRRWVDFLFALVRTAERFALATDPQGTATVQEQQGMHYPNQRASAGIEDFCKLLGLGSEEVDYWTGRWGRYQKERELDRPRVETRRARERKAELAAEGGWENVRAWVDLERLILHGDDVGI